MDKDKSSQKAADEPKKEEERFFKPQSHESLNSFEELTIEWKEAVLFDKDGDILWHLHRQDKEKYNGLFKKTEEIKEKLKNFLEILNNPKETIKDYDKDFKTLHKYFFSKGVEFGRTYNLLRLNPPFMIFRDFITEEGLCIVNVKS